MDIERVVGSLNYWRIHTIEYPNRPAYVTLSNADMEELMQVVLGKKPNEGGEEPEE